MTKHLARRLPRFFTIANPILLSCLLCASASAMDAPKTLIFEADNWCPINCETGENPAGIGVELVKKIYEPLGYTINYRIVPWQQALNDARSGTIDGVIGANQTDEPRLIFPGTPITTISDDFFVLKGNPWRYQGPYTLNGKRLGVVTDYGYSGIVNKYINDNKGAERHMIVFASGSEAVRSNIMNLRDDKAQVIVESKMVMDYWLRKLNLTTKVDYAGGVPQDRVYVAFSPTKSTSRDLARAYDDGMARMRRTGEVVTLYRNYGIPAQ